MFPNVLNIMITVILRVKKFIHCFYWKTLHCKPNLVLVIQPSIFKSCFENIYTTQGVEPVQWICHVTCMIFHNGLYFTIDDFFPWRCLWCINDIFEISWTFSRRKKLRNLQNRIFFLRPCLPRLRLNSKSDCLLLLTYVYSLELKTNPVYYLNIHTGLI